MKGRAVVMMSGVWGASFDCEIDATFGDYGRSNNPSIEVVAPEKGFTFEFSSPDEARQMGERLFALARKAEEKSCQRGPEYRAQLAREEFLGDLRGLVQRVEQAVADKQIKLPDALTSQM